MKFRFRLTGGAYLDEQRNNMLHKCLWINNKRHGHLSLWFHRLGLGTDADLRRETR